MMFGKIDFTKKLWWLWIPLAATTLQIALEATLSVQHLTVMLSEYGPHEAVQFFILLFAFIVALTTLIRMPKDDEWLVAWIVLATLGCLYVAGEEISWGQWVFKWGTPEFWSVVNDQNETNLHNTSSWLDQKPRLILTIGIYVGGLIIPLLRKYKPAALPSKFARIYPPSRLCVIALLLLALLVVKTVQGNLHIRLLERSSEIEEIFIYYFTFLYLIDLRGRILPR